MEDSWLWGCKPNPRGCAAPSALPLDKSLVCPCRSMFVGQNFLSMTDIGGTSKYFSLSFQWSEWTGWMNTDTVPSHRRSDSSDTLWRRSALLRVNFALILISSFLRGLILYFLSDMISGNQKNNKKNQSVTEIEFSWGHELFDGVGGQLLSSLFVITDQWLNDSKQYAPFGGCCFWWGVLSSESLSTRQREGKQKCPWRICSSRSSSFMRNRRYWYTSNLPSPPVDRHSSIWVGVENDTENIHGECVAREDYFLFDLFRCVGEEYWWVRFGCFHLPLGVSQRR